METPIGTEQSVHFVPAPIPPNETERIAALRTLDILDSAEEDIYNSITQAAADVCQTSMASLTFIDEHRQWFKSRVGLKDRETPRDISFCGHAINGADLFLVPDAMQDQRFRENPFVVGNPHLRFYAGVPLRTASGLGLGTLCVLDTVPRLLSEQQKNALEALAVSVMRVLALRKNIGVAVFAKAVDIASDGVTISDFSEGAMRVMYANESFLQLTGYAYVEVINQNPTFPIGPDCPAAQQAFAEAETKGQMTTVECQFQRKDGEVRWARASFVPYVDDSHNLKYVVSIHRDITALKEADLQARYLYAMRTTMASVSHVVKNFLNSAQLFSSQVNAAGAIDPSFQRAFTAALESTRAQLSAIDRMATFRDKPTPFGFTILDTDEQG